MKKTIKLAQAKMWSYRSGLLFVAMLLFNTIAAAENKKTTDISHLISAKQFSAYKNVADFIDDSPKVTIMVEAQPEDIKKYGKNVGKSLTGFDCDRDGVMDDNPSCNAVYYKLWLKYQR